VWRYLRPRLPSVVAANVLALILALITSAVTVLVGPALQVITSTGSSVLKIEDLVGPRIAPFIERLTGITAMTASELFMVLPWALVSLALVKAVVGAAQWFMWERAGELVALNLRRDLAHQYITIDPARRRTQESRGHEAELAGAATSDVRLLREYIVHFYGGLPREVLQAVFLMVQLALLSPKLTLIFLIGIVPAVAAAQRIGKKVRRRAAKALDDYSLMTEWLQQRLLGVETIKHYGTEAIEVAKMHQLSQSLYERFLGAVRVKARTSPAIEAFAVISLALVLVIALRDVASGATTGSIQMSFFATLAMLTQAGAKLGRYVNSNREGAAAVDRLQAVTGFFTGAARPLITAGQTEKGLAARLILEGVTARYPEANGNALTNFSYSFEAGRIYCLAGPSGAGKSSVFNIVLGLLKPTEGRVRFLAPAGDPRRLVTYMPQKVQLVPDTVAANVAYPDVTFDTARVEAALAKVGLRDVVSSMPSGLQTLVGEGGRGMSGGQAQRLLLARLWYARAPFVLVDEGTSALDPELEGVVHELLRELANQGAVVMTIAHRQSAADRADTVLKLEAGRLVI